MQKIRIGRYGLFLHGMLAVLCVLVVLLAVENRRLKRPQEPRSSASTLTAGDALPTVKVHDLDGRPFDLRFDESGRDTLVMIFTTTCGICKENLGNWLDLYERLGDQHDFVAVGLDDPQAVSTYSARNSLPFRVVTPADRQAFMEGYGIRGVPQTLLVNGAGQLARIRAGLVRDW